MTNEIEDIIKTFKEAENNVHLIKGHGAFELVLKALEAYRAQQTPDKQEDWLTKQAKIIGKEYNEIPKNKRNFIEVEAILNEFEKEHNPNDPLDQKLMSVLPELREAYHPQQTSVATSEAGEALKNLCQAYQICSDSRLYQTIRQALTSKQPVDVDIESLKKEFTLDNFYTPEGFSHDGVKAWNDCINHLAEQYDFVKKGE